MSDSNIGPGPELLPRNQQIMIGAASGVAVFAVCLTGFLIVRSLVASPDEDVAVAKVPVPSSPKPPATPKETPPPGPATSQPPAEKPPARPTSVPPKDAPVPIPGLPSTERVPIPGLPAIETPTPGPAPKYDEDKIPESSFLQGAIVPLDESILNPTEADFRRRQAMELEDTIEHYEERLAEIEAAIAEGGGTAEERAELKAEAAEIPGKLASARAKRAKLGPIAEDPLADVAKSLESGGSSEVGPSTPTPISPSRPSGVSRPPSRKHAEVPSKESRQAANKELEEIFDFSKSRSDEDELKLAQELYGLGMKAPKGSGERYVLLQKSAGLAGAGGDARMMLNAVDRMAQEFEIDALTGKGLLLAKFAKDANTSKKVQALLTAARRYVPQAIGAGKPKFAETVANLTNDAAQRTSDRDLRKAAVDFRRKVQKDCGDLVKVANAKVALEANPNDPDAHLVLGQFHCLSQGNWAKGLGHLSKGSDPNLAQAAAKELARPSSASGYVEVGDAWWTAAASRQNEEKEEVLRHAAWWYRKGLPELSGLEKAKVRKRLEGLGESAAPKRG